MVTGIGKSGSSWADYRAKATDAAAQGKLGLAAAQAYLQSTTAVTPAAIPATTVSQPLAQQSQDAPDGTDGNQEQTAQSDGSSFTPFQSAADFSQMLAAQEAGSQTAQAQSAPQAQSSSSPLFTGRALGAYAATLALTEEPSATEMQSPGWSGSSTPGQAVSLMA